MTEPSARASRSEPADFDVARRRKSVSTRSSSARRRAIADARRVAVDWHNPDVTWGELERQMSGRAARDRTVHNPEADSAPGYSHKRPAYAADQEQVQRPAGPVVPYAELHCHSNFSFLDGVERPGGADRGGRTARAGRAGHHRPRRLLRRLPVRRGGGGVRPADDLRRRAVAGPDRAAERGRRSGGAASAGAGPRGRGLPPAGRGDHRGPAARRREGPPGLRPGGARRRRPAGTG